MSHEVETMAYANEVPWHGLGVNVPADLTPAQMSKKAGIDWTVSKRAMFLESGKEVNDNFALVRDTDESVLSVVGKSYKPIQNESIMEFFSQFVKSGDMNLETAGSLKGGKFIWALARINQDFEVGKGDEVRPYLLMMQPHAYGYSLTFKYTPVRVVCWNTLSYALGANLRGRKDAKASIFRMAHSAEWNESMEEKAKLALGLAKKQTEEFYEVSKLLSKRKVSDDVVKAYFGDLIGYDPQKAKTRKDGEVKESKMLSKLLEAYHKAPGQDMKTAKGTLWGAVNAVTFVTDHQMGRTRDTAVFNSWLGNTATMKQQAVKRALELAD